MEQQPQQQHDNTQIHNAKRRQHDEARDRKRPTLIETRIRQAFSPKQTRRQQQNPQQQPSRTIMSAADVAMPDAAAAAVSLHDFDGDNGGYSVYEYKHTDAYISIERRNERTNERTKSRRSPCLFVVGDGALADMSHVVFRMYLLNTQTNTHTQ